jgi:NAD-dependent deacetylase sirtuin 2
MRVLGLSQGMDFTSEDSRDVAWLGDCDTGCEALAATLGWAVRILSLVFILFAQ